MSAQRTFEAVQAACLDSEEEPGEAVQAGLDAVVMFAMECCEASEDGVRHMVENAIRRAQQAIKDG